MMLDTVTHSPDDGPLVACGIGCLGKCMRFHIDDVGSCAGCQRSLITWCGNDYISACHTNALG
jgi:hypothetical protein